MKRLAWLLLVAFSAVMAQVQPVDVHLLPVKKCCCCEQPGDCGMRDCGLPPTTGQRVLPVAETAPVMRAAAERLAPGPRQVADRLYTRHLVRLDPIPARSAVPVAAAVPLFKEHCSFLI